MCICQTLAGLEVARRIKAGWLEVEIVILTVFDEYLDEALAAVPTATC